jgi:tetratricopeptide (TPR) repeat protein
LTGEGVDLQGGQISEEIFKCIDISFSLLTDRARSGLVAFSPFTSFLNAMILEDYLEALQSEGLFQETTLAHLEKALAQAEKQGLVKEEGFKKCYALQPVFPFFLWQQVVTEGAWKCREGAAALEKAFCRYMSVLAQSYELLMESKESRERQVGQYLFQQDRENLQKALNRVLAEQGDFYALYIVFAYYYHENPNYHEAIAWIEEVAGKLEEYANSYTNKDSEFLGKYAVVVGNLGTQYSKIKDYFQAKKKQKKALELYEKAGRRQEVDAVYHQLGNIAFLERDFAEALRDYSQALEIWLQYNDEYNAGIAKRSLDLLFTAWEPRPRHRGLREQRSGQRDFKSDTGRKSEKKKRRLELSFGER